MNKGVRGRRAATRQALALAVAQGIACMALGGSLVALPGWANAAEQAGQEFDIAAGPLAGALNQFGKSAHILLSYPAQLVEGKSSPGLKGRHEIASGLAQLLAGSGLQPIREANGNYTLMLAVAPEALQLGEVSISGKAPGSITEGTGLYTTYSSSSSTRLNLTPKETPQTLTVMTRQRLDDQKLTSLNEVLDATSGITVSHASVGAENNTYWSRGFMINNFEIDGVPTSSRIDNSTQYTAMYDRIEIVRGATGLISGTGTPGATINLIRKRPTYDPQFSVSAEAGSWDRYGTGFDASGPLNESGSIRGRLVVDIKDQGSWVDRMSSDSQLVYGISEFDLSDATLLTAGFSYANSHTNSPLRVGFPVYFTNGVKTDLPRSTNSAAEWAYYDRKVTNVFTSLEHRFANGWSGKVELSHTQNSFDQVTTFLNGGIDQQTGAGSYMYPNRWSGTPRQNNLDAYFTGPFSLFGREHELIVGTTLSRYTENTPDRGGWQGPWTGYDGTIGNFLDWDGSGPKPSFAPVGKNYITENQYALYLSSRFNLRDDLHLMLGGRVTDWKRESENQPYDGAATYSSENRHGIFLPYTGLVYDLDDTWSVYGSYTKIFNPQSYGMKDINGKPLEPQEGVGYEVGVKGSFNDDKLNASLALFRIEQDNLGVWIADPDIYRTEKGTTTKGVELALDGQLAEGWQLMAGYAYSVSTSDEDERIVTNIPRHSVKTFTTYRLPGVLDKVTVGGGVNWQSKYGQDLHAFTQGSYALVNLMARYEVSEDLSLKVNLNNALDKKYYAYSDTWGVYGEPRNVMTSVEYRF
ncbi:TonB-dependent siderophore receptor [Pseudomonas sp. 148P]|uniref:TonB-dependent siderophore receptor n=1 Tax=Pseudomonas ulcerans TaxID=3115852 RepID=A0ABU7HPR7_9PSED|nr:MULTISPECIES: TonB-dependent siderophore receptor [unclassified Pseudomonas]MEE1921952.1 TonB-dependent siderophore receptor [Pseudomonas sp. 147P]MEE1933536.1 TonB-dependent siderophore receptor [Pseudomonas sp. 148P]